jgi:hypothetical protein
MIKAFDDLSIDALVDVYQVANHTRGGIYLPTDRYLYTVIVTMAMGVVALAIYVPILGFTYTVAMQAVGCGEHVAPGQVCLHDSSP